LRKRTLVIGVTVALTALVTAVVAFAVTQRTYKQDFGTKDFTTNTVKPPTKKPGAPTGSYFKETTEDPANTDNNKQGKRDAYVNDFFPKGAAIDQGVPKSCKATDQEISNDPATACPPKSRVGKGFAKVRVPFNGFADINATIDAFNCKSDCAKSSTDASVPTKNQLIFYVNPSGSNPLILRGQVGKQDGSPFIHVPVPITCLIGTAPECQDARISSFELSINKITKTVHKNGKTIKKPFARTPKTCPSNGKWKFHIVFHGRDGIDQVKQSKSPCKQPS
jgi:hypothetical protein